MSTPSETCYTLVCDGCGAVYDDGEGRVQHFESADAIRHDGTAYGDWSSEDGQDLCPACTCAKIGHRPRTCHGYIECTRCYEPLTSSLTVVPSEAFL